MQALTAALNSVEPRVWSIVQFALLIGVLCFGGWLVVKGHTEAGSPLCAGALALLKVDLAGTKDA